MCGFWGPEQAAVLQWISMPIPAPRDLIRPHHTIHAVAFQTGSNWVAQCLEYDIATQASSLDSLLEELKRILAAQVCASAPEGMDPFSDIPKAPRRFWEMYRRARANVEPARSLELLPIGQRPRVEVRAILAA